MGEREDGGGACPLGPLAKVRLVAGVGAASGHRWRHLVVAVRPATNVTKLVYVLNVHYENAIRAQKALYSFI